LENLIELSNRRQRITCPFMHLSGQNQGTRKVWRVPKNFFDSGASSFQLFAKEKLLSVRQATSGRPIDLTGNGFSRCAQPRKLR
jgi:hypothetical protein